MKDIRDETRTRMETIHPDSRTLHHALRSCHDAVSPDDDVPGDLIQDIPLPEQLCPPLRQYRLGQFNRPLQASIVAPRAGTHGPPAIVSRASPFVKALDKVIKNSLQKVSRFPYTNCQDFPTDKACNSCYNVNCDVDTIESISSHLAPLIFPPVTMGEYPSTPPPPWMGWKAFWGPVLIVQHIFNVDSDSTAAGDSPPAIFSRDHIGCQLASACREAL